MNKGSQETTHNRTEGESEDNPITQSEQAQDVDKGAEHENRNDSDMTTPSDPNSTQQSENRNEENQHVTDNDAQQTNVEGNDSPQVDAGMSDQSHSEIDPDELAMYFAQMSQGPHKLVCILR